MMFPSRMTQLVAVVLERDVENVTRALLAEGVMQFISISAARDEPTETMRGMASPAASERIASLRGRIETLLTSTGLHPDLPGPADLDDRTPVDPNAVAARLDEINGEIQRLRDKQRAVQQEIMKIEDIQRNIDTFGPDIAEAVRRPAFSFITMRIGRIPAARVQKFDDEIKQFPAVAIRVNEEKDWVSLVIMAMKRDASRMERLLQAAGWADVELTGGKAVLAEDVARGLDAQLSALRAQQESLGREADNAVRRNAGELKKTWIRLRVHELTGMVRSFFRTSAWTTIFSGWLPASKQESLSRKIREAARGRCYLEWLAPGGGSDMKSFEGSSPPVQLKNPRFLAPFQMLVANFGIPEYRSVDPTPYVTVTYLLMFGVMFADAGHGLILTLLGACALVFGKHLSGNVRNLSALLVWCGCSSIAFGVLFGSYFGRGFFTPLWFDFHGLVSGYTENISSVRSILDVLGITVYFGIIVIATGLAFNWINLVLKKKWFDLVFDLGGILGGWIYAGGLVAARAMVASGYRDLPGAESLTWLVGVPALAFGLKAPIRYFFLQPHPGHSFGFSTLFHFLMDWVVELLEIFTRYLSNTLSFMRVAGLGIAHISLMIATYELALTAQGKGPANLFSVLIIIVGNVFVIGLEGLSAGIQALRLNYYEFFTKFFHGTGRLYSPISLRSK